MGTSWGMRKGVVSWALIQTAVLLWSFDAPLAAVLADRDALASTTFTQIVAQFNMLETASIDGEKWTAYTNENGALAWGTSYLLDAYLTMYETTRDRKYLDKFTMIADAVADRTDARRDLVDYKGRKRKGWGAVKYSQAGERVVWLVHTGMITYPLVRFALIVGQMPSLYPLIGNAAYLQRLSEAAVREFDDQWRYDPSHGVGYYVFEDSDLLKQLPGSEMPVPFNQQLAAGRTFIILWKLTGNPAYRLKAEGLARHFKEHLRRDSTGAFRWDYWYGKGLLHYNSTEDVSHGAIDVDFALLAGRESLVFTDDDLARFGAAFFRDTNVRDGKMLEPNDAVGRWLDLAEVECGVYHAVAPYLMGKKGAQHPQVLLGVAKLTKYVGKCAIRQ